MRLRTVLANMLADLILPELRDQPRTQHDREQQRGDACHRRADGRVLEKPERRIVMEQFLVKKPVKHQFALPSSGAKNCSSARSTCTPRDPLNKMASPDCAIV